MNTTGARRAPIERALSTIPAHPSPDPALEQYATPADIAADVLFEAFALGDIGGRSVYDLGCGTGVLAIGAALLGAMPVMGFDLDETAVGVAREHAQRLGASQCEFFAEPVDEVPPGADTVVSNPPFGAQQRHADRPFIEAANRCGRIAYTFHLATTRDWVENRVQELGGEVTHAWGLEFPIKAQFWFHDKPVSSVDVVVLRWETAGKA